jgi:hypothetical protein
MKKITSVIFFFLLLMNLSFLTAMSYPHAFHGIINVDDGSNPNEQTLIGKINGIATGSCVISDGKYDLVIEDVLGEGGKIEFYIGYEKAKEISEFITFEVTELDLAFDTIPLDLGDCGNDICDNGECSSCPIDCRISECLGDGICDLEMGEDCTTASEDCGVCTTNDDDSGEGNSGGGGSNPPSNQNDGGVIVLDEQEDILSVEELNEADEQRDLDSVGTGLGAVLGFVKSVKGVGLVFGLVILALGITVFITQKRKGKSNEKISNSSIGDTPA